MVAVIIDNGVARGQAHGSGGCMRYIGSGVPAPPAVEVVRGGIIESVHRAHIAVVGPDGRLLQAAGDPEVRVFARSSLKPLIAAAMVDLGFRPSSPQSAALSAASHSGEPFHVASVQAMLAAVGLNADALANTPDWPFDETARVAWIAGGGQKTRLHANCSGKHAAMLTTCVVNGWDVGSYLSPSHPLPMALGEAVAASTGADPADVAVDGCGAAIWAVPLVGLASAFAGLAAAAPGSSQRVIADGMRAAPEFVGGSRREATELMRAFPGMIAKDGADGVYAATLPDGRGVALKLEDGAPRARPAAIAGTLALLGLDPAALAPVLDWEKVNGGGRPVGQMRPVMELREV